MTIFKPRFFITSIATALALSACVSSDVPVLPESDVPEGWEGPVVDSAEVWPETDWWNNFNDDELSTLIADVQESNLDLANNLRNLESAQIALREAGFNLLPIPSVNIGTGANYSELRTDEVNTSSSTNVPLQLGASLNYNDILSKPATYDRALADYDSRVAQVADVALNTMGTAASTYFSLLLIRDKIEAANQNVMNAEEIGSIAQARVAAGVAVPIEALQQQIALENERSRLRSLVQNDLAARSSLSLLLGRSVQGFDVEGQTLQDINVPNIQPGVPSDLLRRRPDLVQAEAALRGASANVDLVRTDFFPQISLTGSINASSTSLNDLVFSPETALTINANLVQTLLDNGQRSRNLEQAELSLESNLANYRKSVLSAFNEVEVLLSNIQLLEVQTQVALNSLGLAEESFRIAQVRYEEGVADYQTVLTSQNSLFSSRNSYLDNKIQQLNAMVGFYQALGGGWEQGVE
jgi:outer membrane protein, multidrug efflux system